MIIGYSRPGGGGGGGPQFPSTLGLFIWYDAFQEMGLSDNDLTIMHDFSGNSRDSQNGNPVQRVNYRTGVVNSQPAFQTGTYDDGHGNGSQGHFTFTPTFAALNDPCIVAFVGLFQTYEGPFGADLAVSDPITNALRIGHGNFFSTPDFWVMSGSFAATNTAVHNTWNYLVGRFKSASGGYLRANGVDQGISVSNAASGSNAHAIATGGSGPWDGYLAEIMYLNRDFTGTEQADLENYFHVKYGI